MKVYRNNGIVVQCDGCYRIATDLYELRNHWHAEPGLPEAQASAVTSPGGRSITYVQPAQDRHLCPGCKN